MTDTRVADRTARGWAARWDARVLAARDRLAHRAPRLHRALLGWTLAAYLVVDAVLPRRRVIPTATLMVLATILDSVATYLWITERIAVEGNPVVDTVLVAFGDVLGLSLRAGLTVTFVVLLAWLARRHWEARAGMLVAGSALAAITLVHAYGLTVLVG